MDRDSTADDLLGERMSDYTHDLALCKVYAVAALQKTNNSVMTFRILRTARKAMSHFLQSLKAFTYFDR